ncbi:MAG: RNA polymerase sigma factor [Acidobacteria bacterium]|nr:RNA polymerase sigma factor [Acidobacteriota bacterium]
MDRDDILRCLRERIVAFAASRTQRDAAEDLAQEVLILLHEKYAQVTRLEELVPLSLQIVRFKLAGLHRKAQRRGEYTRVSVDEIQIPNLDSSPLTLLERKQMTSRLAAALRQSGERCRSLFRMKLEGKSFPEIQKEMGARSINTIYTWDSRCRKHLLELMEGSWESES